MKTAWDVDLGLCFVQLVLGESILISSNSAIKYASSVNLYP